MASKKKLYREIEKQKEMKKYWKGRYKAWRKQSEEIEVMRRSSDARLAEVVECLMRHNRTDGDSAYGEWLKDTIAERISDFEESDNIVGNINGLPFPTISALKRDFGIVEKK